MIVWFSFGVWFFWLRNLLKLKTKDILLCSWIYGKHCPAPFVDLMIVWFSSGVWFFGCGTYWNWKQKISCFAPESMAVFCGMFYTCKVEISYLLSNCKQMIQLVLKLKDYCLFSFAELKKHVEQYRVEKTCARRQEKQVLNRAGWEEGVRYHLETQWNTKVIRKVALLGLSAALIWCFICSWLLFAKPWNFIK